MTARNYLVAAVASALLLVGLAIGGVAAASADLPEHAADQAKTNLSDRAAGELSATADDRPVNVSNASTGHANATDAALGSTSLPAATDQVANDNRPGSVGPPDGLPDQAADHVSDIHALIESFLDGTIDDLGVQLSDLLGNGDEEVPPDETEQ